MTETYQGRHRDDSPAAHDRDSIRFEAPTRYVPKHLRIASLSAYAASWLSGEDVAA